MFKREMFSRNLCLRLIVLAVIAALLLTACSPAPAPAVQEEPQPAAEEQKPAEVPAAEEKPQEQPAEEAKPAAQEPPSGGTVIFTHLEPATLNPLIRPDQEAWAASIMVTKGLVDLNPKGEWFAVLAAELPSLEKSTVSEDGLTITWKLKPDLKWSDGEPLTSADLVWTWEVCSDLSSGCAQNAGFDKITTIDTPDVTTAIVHYKSFHSDFMGQFRNGILPKHATGPDKNMLKWEWGRTASPGNGPFILKEWVPSDHLTFEKNPNYYEAPKPYVDSVIYKIVPDFEVARQMLKNDETQAMAYLSEPSAIKDMYDNGFTVKAQGAWINFLQINPFDPKDLGKSHPFLGDKKVRQAVYMAIDRTKSTYNWAVQGVFEQSLITSLWDLWPQYRCDVPAWPNDKEGAKKLLEEAGWRDTNGDGILECDSCTTTAKGTPFKIRMSSYTGWGMEDNEVVVIDELKQVGIDAQVQNYEATVMYSSWADGSFMYKGDFDLIWWDDNPLMPDPQQRSMMWYASDFIPSEKNPTGMNFSRINDPEIDAWLKEAGSTPDTAKRKDAYCNIAKKVNQDYIVQQANGLIPYVSVSAPYIKGWDVNEVYAPMGWDIANWYIEK